jgi:hypothetical protein
LVAIFWNFRALDHARSSIVEFDKHDFRWFRELARQETEAGTYPSISNSELKAKLNIFLVGNLRASGKWITETKVLIAEADQTQPKLGIKGLFKEMPVSAGSKSSMRMCRLFYSWKATTEIWGFKAVCWRAVIQYKMIDWRF